MLPGTDASPATDRTLHVLSVLAQHHEPMTAAELMAATGLTTTVPLILFAVAARNLTLSTLGFLQFAAPTLVFLTGVFLLGESLDRLKLACFVLIWVAVALFIWDMWQRTRYLNRPAAS